MSGRFYDFIIGDRGNPFTSLLAIVFFVLMFASPGLLLAIGGNADPLGLFVGLLFFAFAYWVPLQIDEVQRFCRRPEIRKTLRIGYWTLLGSYLVVPVGFGMTIILGSIAASLAGIRFSDDNLGSFASVNAGHIVGVTVIYGTLLHLVLGVYMAIVYAAIRWTGGKQELNNLCRVCGYDIRASPIRCPECGMPVPPTSSSDGDGAKQRVVTSNLPADPHP